jgi:signal transduction histidine kinase
LAGRAFPVAFSTALAVLLVGIVWIILIIRRELKTSISGLSIKQAMDSLDTAVLFCRKDGHILMQNNRMQELMLQTAGRVFYNGRVYFETNVIPNSENAGIDSYLYRFADNVWLFTICDIQAGRKIVTRITAADVTEQNKAAIILKDRNVELESRRQRLKAFVENIEQICRAEELLRIKTEIHDVQNKKLILLLQYLRYGELPDSTSFDALKTGILQGTCANADMAVDPQAMLDIIVGQHESIGVKININGNLPPQREGAIALAQILQEAAANSVAHGYASEIHVRIMDNNGKYTMRVTDNGKRLVTDVKEGSGIAGMRRCAETCGGTLGISTAPCFTVTAQIPIST